MAAPTTADARVADWPSLTRVAGAIYRLASGGFFVEIGDAYPVYQPDEADARCFLRASGFPANGPVIDFEPAAS